MIIAILMISTATTVPASTVITSGVAVPVVQQPPAQPAKERLVCRTQDRLGSRVGGKRVCNTKARWAEIEGDAISAVRDAQRDRASLPSNGF